jgi:hypothetical protein
MTETKRIYVLMLNDGPVAVTRDEDNAIQWCNDHNRWRGGPMLYHHYVDVEDLDNA